MTSNPQIHDLSLAWLDTDTSIKTGWIKLVLWFQTTIHSEMMWACKHFTHVSKMPAKILLLLKPVCSCLEK
jgi:hypothetical protein